jgi:hypothetical protein
VQEAVAAKAIVGVKARKGWSFRLSPLPSLSLSLPLPLSPFLFLSHPPVLTSSLSPSLSLALFELK